MNKEKALSLAAAICSKKEHCSWEIQEKLVKWEIPEKEIDRIMTFLHQHRFIDDARYAQAYAEDKFRFNHWGKQKIALMLHRKKSIRRPHFPSIRSVGYRYLSGSLSHSVKTKNEILGRRRAL